MESDDDLESIRRQLVDWFNESGRAFPWRSSPTPYEILIAEILLQRTFAEKVKPVYEDLISRYPGLDTLAEADEESLEELLEPLGLQRKKAGALVGIGRQTRESGLPRDEEGLRKLPYVGRYAANAILCFGHDENRSIVDSNVIRIFNRLWDLDLEDDRDENAWDIAEVLLPREHAQEFNLGLLDLGAEICTPSRPDCESCPLKEHCSYFQTIRS